MSSSGVLSLSGDGERLISFKFSSFAKATKDNPHAQLQRRRTPKKFRKMLCCHDSPMRGGTHRVERLAARRATVFLYPKEIGMKPNIIKYLPKKTGPEEIDPNQGVLDLKVDCQKEVRGIGMGVLSDGTPFLTQRGLSRLCGVENAHIGTISSQWNDREQLPRISKIKSLLERRNISVEAAHLVAADGGRTIYAYPDVVCVAILEYYAFEAGQNCQQDAEDNFRLLAAMGLQNFIYTQVGYDPQGAIPIAWQQFHDRVTAAYGKVPPGYFSVFKEVADIIVTLIRQGADVGVHFMPDISVGKAWSKYWADNALDEEFGDRSRYPHDYPDYFPQSASNPQPAYCYPDAALGDFRKWVREEYIGAGKFAAYLNGKVKNQELPASFVQLAIAAYSNDDETTKSAS